MQIPFINLIKQYEGIRQEMDGALQSVFEQGQFIGGDPVKNFEALLAARFNMPYCISTGNGTDSLFIILKALALKPGDEVITPAFSCIPSAETITLAGAAPVFCDVSREFFTLEPSDVVKKITSKTKAVIAVHLYGQAAPVAELKKICDDRGLYLIEDCAQAHMTLRDSKPVGTFGIASAFSFYPTKNLGAYGDAGCILTRDSRLAEKLKRMTNHGALIKDDHAFEGMNSRMDTLQATVLSVKLNHLNRWNARRRELAALYNSLLGSIEALILPAERESTTHTFHIYCVRTSSRDVLKKHLADRGIETAIHYPKGLPFTDAYRHLNHSPDDFPVTANLQHEVLSLPVYPELTEEEIHYISEHIHQYFSSAKNT